MPRACGYKSFFGGPLLTLPLWEVVERELVGLKWGFTITRALQSQLHKSLWEPQEGLLAAGSCKVGIDTHSSNTPDIKCLIQPC